MDELDIDKELDEATPQTKVVPICLRGALVEEFERLDAELQEITRVETSAPSLASGTHKRELAERVEALRQEMLAKSVPFHLKAMGRTAWTKLLDGHPPRSDSDLDRMRGFNEETFFPALIRASVSSPVLTPERWTKLLDVTLSPGQFETLANAAWELNRRGVDVPFSRVALQTLGRSAPE